MHDLRFAPRTLLAILACTLALGLAACSSDADSSSDDTSATSTTFNPYAVENIDVDRTVYFDPATPIDVEVGDRFGVLLPRPADDIRWVLSPRPDINYVVVQRTEFLADDTRLGAAEPGAVMFRIDALGEGTLTLDFKEVKGTFGEEIPDARTVTYTVNITGDPTMAAPTSTAAAPS